jgi:hypothetical protein
LARSKPPSFFQTGNNPQPDEVNILLNSGVSGTTVTGTPNNFLALVVDFISSELELEPSSGQARVSGSPEGTPLTTMPISLANGGTYGDLIINPFIGGCRACVSGGSGIVTVNSLLIAMALRKRPLFLRTPSTMEITF